MKLYRSIFPFLLGCFLCVSCNNKVTSDNSATDTTGTNPTGNAEDYHPDQRQEIPVTDSSNIIGTDSIGDTKGTKDTIKK